MMARRALAGILIALLAVPATASPSKGSPTAAIPIGTISQSDATNVGGAGALPGTTVFSGDTIEVGPRGSAWILMNSGRDVRVSSDSRIRMLRQTAGANQIEMEIFSGAARFRSGETASVIARLADATVRAKGTQPAVGLISVLSPNLAIVGAEQGELLVSTAHDGRSVTLREGETVELTLADAPTPGTPQEVPQKKEKRRGAAAPTPCGPQAAIQSDAAELTQADAPPPGTPQGVPQKKKKRGGAAAPVLCGTQVAIIGGVVAAILATLAIKLASDNKGLTDQQKKDMVSPFKFP